MVRKKLFLSICVTLVLLFSLSWVCSGKQLKQETIVFKVNEQKIQNVNPILSEKGIVMVSLTDFCDSLGASFTYLPLMQTVNIYHKDKTFKLKTGQGKVVVKDQVVYLPLRDMAQLLGNKINWVSGNKEVQVVTPVNQSAFVFNPQITGGDAKNAIQQLLPAKADLTTPLLEADLDGDGIKEIAAGYRTRQNRVGIIVIKKQEKTFSKVWQKEVQHSSRLTDLFVKDLNKNGRGEIIVGWFNDASAGSRLEVVSWLDGQFRSIFTNDYHRLEVEDFNDDGTIEMALWKKDRREYYQVNIYAWDGVRFALANQAYPAYFDKMVEYYHRLLKTNGQSRILSYYLADAYQQAGRGVEALKTVETGKKMTGSYPSDADFQLLEAKAYSQAKEYEKASKIYRQALADSRLTSTLRSEAYWGLAQAYLALGKKEQALREIRGAVSCSNQWENYQQAKNILLD